MLCGKNYLPFMGVEHEFVKVVKKGKEKRLFRVITYQAYNAMGLIGPESNGIAVLDEDRKCVVSDEIEKQDSGYFGASVAQQKLMEKILAMDAKTFIAFVNASRRLRDPNWL